MSKNKTSKAKRKQEKSKIIAQGAEAILIKRSNKLIKKRIKKQYRHPELDYMLRFYRTRREAKILQRAIKHIAVPKVLKVNEDNGIIEMKYITGKKLSEWLDKLDAKTQQDCCKQIGKNIAMLHKVGIIHNDLTTSNMILSKGKVYFIDFGLAFHSDRVEDKAVDLHLLWQALNSKHFSNANKFFSTILQAYKQHYDKANAVLKQLEKVEARGRYKKKQKKQKD